MCGIAGVLSQKLAGSPERLRESIAAMTARLSHRGPDDCGSAREESAGLALGHRRLAIIDLSASGHQPMESAGGRYVLTYNGEIYNFRELREELGGSYRFRGESDTEVLLAMIERRGLPETLKHVNGMFAFAVWDREDKKLHLARDRHGIKPLYYGWNSEAFLFASELKGIAAFPEFTPTIDSEAAALFLRYGYVPAPYSIYSGIKKLSPGTVLTIDAPSCRATGSLPEPEAYWSAREIAEAGAEKRFAGSFEDAAAQLENLLENSVAMRLVSDVPAGVFLSGGVDSSLIAAYAAKNTRGVRTFAIGFDDRKLDESEYAKKVAAILQTSHTTFMVTGREALDTVGELPEIYDEPFADSSQIPTLLLSRLTRREVTVALSGDGADELFGGYPRHRFADAVFRKSRWLPRPVGNLCGRAAETIPLGMWDATFSLFRKIFPAALRHRNAGDIIPRLAEILKLENKNGIYEALMCQWPGGLPLAGSNAILQTFGSQPPVMLNDIRRMMFADLNLYLPDDILVKVDRASMSAGLEVRVPMLDHRVSEFAATLPDGFLLGGKGKRILRHLLAKKIPEALVERPKKGFGVPLAEWLRGPLREWVEDLLAEESLRKRGLFDPEKVRTVWHQHLSGKADRKYDLWNVLMLQAWLDRWM